MGCKAIWSSAGVVVETLSLPRAMAPQRGGGPTPRLKIKYQRNTPKMRVEVASFKGGEGSPLH